MIIDEIIIQYLHPDSKRTDWQEITTVMVNQAKTP